MFGLMTHLMASTQLIEPSYYINIANHVNVPQDLIFNENTNTVTLNAVKHKNVGSEARNIQLGYFNARFAQSTRFPANYDMGAIYSYVYLNGTYHQAEFGGAAFGTASKNYGKVKTDVIDGLVIPAGAEFYSFTKTVAADAATASREVTSFTEASPIVITCAGGHSYLADQKVRFTGVNSSLNYNSTTSRQYTVKNPTATTFELYSNSGATPINGAGFGTATGGGVAERVYTHYGTTTGSEYTQDGAIYSKDVNIDITTVAFGAKALPLTESQINGSGAVTGITVDSSNDGTGYTVAGLFSLWYGTAGADEVGYEHPGRGASGNTSNSGGSVVSVTVSNGGSKHSASDRPVPYFRGTGSVGSGWGIENGCFGPCVIFGNTAELVPAVLCLGDSYNAVGPQWPDGCGSPEERCMIDLGYSYHRVAVNGVGVVEYVTDNAEYLALFDTMYNDWGIRWTHFYNALAVNDFQADHSLTVVRENNNAVNELMRTRYNIPKLIVTEVPPSTSSTDGYLTLAGQSYTVIGGDTNAYGSGGWVEQYNAGLVANDGQVPYDYLYRGNSVLRDATDNAKFNIQLFKTAQTGVITDVSDGGGHATITSSAHGLTTHQFTELSNIGGATALNSNRYRIYVVDTNSFALNDPIAKTASAISKANPAVVTSNGHGLSTGDTVTWATVSGMTALSNTRQTITVINANSFSLDGVDSTAYPTLVGTPSYYVGVKNSTTYTSGGAWNRVRGSSSDGIHANSTARQAKADYGLGFTLTP